MKLERDYSQKGIFINYLNKRKYTVEYSVKNSFGLWFMTTVNIWVYSEDIR